MSTEQEYDAQPPDMVDDHDQPDSSAGPGPYPTPFGGPQLPSMTSNPNSNPNAPPPPPPQRGPPQHQQHQQQGTTPQSGDQAQASSGYNSMAQQLLDPYDPMLDMDPFGLSASMHFPTQFTFDTSSMR